MQAERLAAQSPAISSDGEIVVPPCNNGVGGGYSIGQNEMDFRVRTFDWSQTPLGDSSEWPQSLKAIVQILLTSRLAMWMGWGPDLTFLYNDTYGKMTLGG